MKKKKKSFSAHKNFQITEKFNRKLNK